MKNRQRHGRDRNLLPRRQQQRLGTRGPRQTDHLHLRPQPPHDLGTGGGTSTYAYDPYGRLRTIQGGGKTQEKYTYDGFDHVTRHEKLGTDGVTTTVTTYTYDPLDRTTTKTEKEGTANAKTTTYSYLGLSGEVLDEEVAGQLVKSFQYSPWGERLSR